MKQINEKRIEEVAEKIGLTAEVKAGGIIFVKSLYDGHWKVIDENDGWRIEHENYHLGGSCRRGTYHKHQQYFKSPIDALYYIQKHDSGKLHRRKVA